MEAQFSFSEKDHIFEIENAMKSIHSFVVLFA